MAETTENAAPEFVPSPEYLARDKRLNDAFAMKQPDRVPIVAPFGYFVPEFGGITHQEYHDDGEKAHLALEKTMLHFQPDCGFGVSMNPAASKILGDQMTKWPGYGLGAEGSFQFNEKEFMKADDYDTLLADPTDYALRKYLPQAFTELEPLAALPPLGMWLYGFYNVSSLMNWITPPMMAALTKLHEAAGASLAALGNTISSAQRMAALGFPSPSFMMGAMVEAPFDFMSDTLRGMRGIFLDMLKQPEKLLLAEDRVKDIMIEYVVTTAEATGIPMAMFPLHRGSDGFMSLKQFEQFYWPQWKEMIVEFANRGITSTIFYEGKWDDRLEYLTQFPKGKTIGLFQSSDIFKVKEVLGDTMAIMGGMSTSMLRGSSDTEIREHTHNVCETVGKGGGFVMTTGVLELEGCQPEKIKTWIDATKEFGVY